MTDHQAVADSVFSTRDSWRRGKVYWWRDRWSVGVSHRISIARIARVGCWIAIELLIG